MRTPKMKIVRMGGFSAALGFGYLKFAGVRSLDVWLVLWRVRVIW